MTALLALWLPILVASVLVFVVSAILHMAPLWHKNDYPALPDQEAFRSAVAPLRLPPGDYMVPRAPNTAAMRTPEFGAKMAEGPVAILTVMPNRMISMGRSMSLWFVYILVVSIFCAYVAGRALPGGASERDVFRFAGTAAFLSYAVALWQMSIWYQRSWSLTVKDTLDGLIYACVTAAVFAWLWP